MLLHYHLLWLEDADPSGLLRVTRVGVFIRATCARIMRPPAANAEKLDIWTQFVVHLWLVAHRAGRRGAGFAASVICAGNMAIKPTHMGI